MANGDNRAMMMIAEIAQCLLQHAYPGFEGLDVTKFVKNVSIDSIKQVCGDVMHTLFLCPCMRLNDVRPAHLLAIHSSVFFAAGGDRELRIQEYGAKTLNLHFCEIHSRTVSLTLRTMQAHRICLIDCCNFSLNRCSSHSHPTCRITLARLARVSPIAVRHELRK